MIAATRGATAGVVRYCLLLVGLASVAGGCGTPGGGSSNTNASGNVNGAGNANVNGISNANANVNMNVEAERPALLGLDTAKPLILPLQVQVAYNDDTVFFRLQYQGDRGDRHDYQHFVNGAWRTEGGHRRDGQATIDDDPRHGRTDMTSTIYEGRATFLINDPNGPNAVADFGKNGCMLTCHDDGRFMPTWRPEDGEVHKYLADDHPGILDLWHWRIARANPTGYSDDQYVSTIPPGGEEGSRNNDAGTHPARTNSLDDAGNPAFVFDPASTAGDFAFPFEELYTTDLFDVMDPAAADLGPFAPNPVALAYADALAMGYTPSEGDAVPARILQQPTDSAADITATGSEFSPSAADPQRGTWVVHLQRRLDTGQAGDDIALADGSVYDIAFAVHTDKVTVRDHYVSFAYTLSLDGGGADVEAVRVAGSGNASPNFADTSSFPVTTVNLFLPGITSWEFLTNADVGQTFIDPRTELPVDQTHGGATFMQTQGLGCRDCHTAAAADTFNPTRSGGFNAGSMEALAGQRGGVLDPNSDLAGVTRATCVSKKWEPTAIQVRRGTRMTSYGPAN